MNNTSETETLYGTLRRDLRGFSRHYGGKPYTFEDRTTAAAGTGVRVIVKGDRAVVRAPGFWSSRMDMGDIFDLVEPS